MSKLVDKERLARLAAALDARAKAAVKAEEDRAVAVEEALQADIDAINNEQTGILAQAKAHVAEEIGKVNTANGALDGRVDALEQADTEMQAEIDANKTAINVLNGAADKEGSVAKAVADAKAALQGQINAVVTKNGEQDTAIEAAQQQADKGVSDAAAVAARATALEAKDVAHEGRLNGVEGRLDVLEGDGEGSVAKAVEDAASNLQGQVDVIKGEIGKKAADEQAATGLYKVIADGDAKSLADAKAYADQKITALVNGAPEAMDTLNELAKAISDHQGVYDAYVQTVTAELAKKVDKVEGSRLVAETEIAKFNAKAEVADVNQALEDAKGYTDEKIAPIVTKNGEQDTAIAAAKTQADKGVADAAAVATRATALEEDVADHETRIAAVEKVADDNKKAIAVLNGDNATVGSVDKKIADALAAYTDTEDLKVMLGNVVNSLALSMEENKLKLKLGGVEGITIHETSLDMATDKDIDDIIAGLDA